MLLNECAGQGVFSYYDDMNKKTYGFKSKHHPGLTKELESFEKELFAIATVSYKIY